MVGSVESERAIRRSLESLQRSLAGISSEVIVVDASRDKSADIAEEVLGTSAVIRCPVGTLTPALWARGIERTKGQTVALTTGHFVFPESWASELIAGVSTGVKGVAGTFALSDATSVTDWAVFYLRYSEFLVEPSGVDAGIHNIPADNAAYEGEAIRQHVTTMTDGFWEVEYHRRLREVGGKLALVPRATAVYDRSFPLGTIVGHRFRHGRHAGAWRSATGQRSAVFVAAASPLVPFALASRVWRRVRHLDGHRARFMRSLPQFLLLASAWAAGEAVGAVMGPEGARSSAPLPV